ncbi:MAG: ribosome biogenesis/translation initiation ATPase RLI [Nanoarchaeota archaeon]
MSRIAIVEREKCNPLGCGNFLCMRLCPVNRAGQECITQQIGKAAIDAALCSGCGICPKRCPFSAIHIINLPDELDEKIIHQYGENGFHLYSLPTPIFGKVVGVIGKNAIGKSTAIKILAGVLKPNMGQDKETSVQDLITFFKGSEAQNFFEAIAQGKIKISYKPQQIDQIPKLFSGTVGDLLKKVDERGVLAEMVDKLELRDVLDTDIAKVSGGELQRVAIAATAMKDANLLLFDEPTSYLDIKQRIKLGAFIRSLCNEQTAVMVIEHDLIALDFMADLVHIMYGKEGAYGIVSLPKPSRAGINVYLSGYLREENMRFREYEIKFQEKPPMKIKARQPLVAWPRLKQSFGRFELEAEEGMIERHATVGILGENGIGKTSFARILTGEVKGHDIAGAVRVSYKAQYLQAGDELVATVLKKAIDKFEVLLMRSLSLKELLTKKLSELSGGELQRVAIARCLAEDAELFLLDEPSAYLDVEQRLSLARIIHERLLHSGASALVVDHDLLFIESMAERLVVFSGKPAAHGLLEGPFSMEDGMNRFLAGLGITLRRDPDSKRPRINKEGSQKDREQKDSGKLYYT